MPLQLVFVGALAQNDTDILDSVLLRPGRIDRKIDFPLPGPEARLSIVRIHSREVCHFLFLFFFLQKNVQMSLQSGINLRAAEVRGICTEVGERDAPSPSPIDTLHLFPTLSLFCSPTP